MAAGVNGNSYPAFPMTATKTTMVAGFAGGSPVRRIRTPNPQDVLSGRGGGINSHKGNQAFREWVYQRKEEYNLAQNKREKIAVAMQVVRQVQQQNPMAGRFLQKDPTLSGGSGVQWWVEVDESKALAKTTQALREGAPKIRQAHQKTDNSPQNTTEKAKKRKRKAPVVATATETTEVIDDATEKLVLQTVKQDAASLPRYKSEQMLLPTTEYAVALEQLQENVQQAKHEADQRQDQVQPQPLRSQAASAMTTLLAPLTSNKTFNKMYGQHKDVSSTKSRFNPLTMPAIDPFAETPPLMAVSEPDRAVDIPVLSLNEMPAVDSFAETPPLMAVQEPILAENIPMLSLDRARTIVVDDIANRPDVQSPNKRRRLSRSHSLALSDVDGSNLYPATDELVEFVNPFADESNVLVSVNDPSVVKAHVPSSVFDQWSNKNGNANANGTAIRHNNHATDHSSVKTTSASTKLKNKSVGGYLNRLLSFSSTSLAAKTDSETGNQSRCNDENQNCMSNSNSDYFFHDVIPESDVGEGMKSIFDVVHPDWTFPENKSSTSSLIRRTSFASRNRSLVSGRQ